MDEKSRPTIDQIFLDIESLLDNEAEPAAESEPLTIVVQSTYKLKFDELQDRTGKKFGKKLKELIYLAIDRALEK